MAVCEGAKLGIWSERLGPNRGWVVGRVDRAYGWLNEGKDSSI
jgi:hypothetical protein